MINDDNRRRGEAPAGGKRACQGVRFQKGFQELRLLFFWEVLQQGLLFSRVCLESLVYGNYRM